mmetsp:Transcript_44115/g.103951  ORF Transcript_44115/g.103951 Transcript_44115/m.103951 type:complete len:333 (+) Transcript_44115:140-1138(+)
MRRFGRALLRRAAGNIGSRNATSTTSPRSAIAANQSYASPSLASSPPDTPSTRASQTLRVAGSSERRLRPSERKAWITGSRSSAVTRCPAAAMRRASCPNPAVASTTLSPERPRPTALISGSVARFSFVQIRTSTSGSSDDSPSPARSPHFSSSTRPPAPNRIVLRPNATPSLTSTSSAVLTGVVAPELNPRRFLTRFSAASIAESSPAWALTPIRSPYASAGALSMLKCFAFLGMLFGLQRRLRCDVVGGMRRSVPTTHIDETPCAAKAMHGCTPHVAVCENEARGWRESGAARCVMWPKARTRRTKAGRTPHGPRHAPPALASILVCTPF